jgi:hypothetical protein
MTLENLTPEAKRELFKQLEAEQRADRLQKEKEIETYKTMQDSMVVEVLPLLVEFADQQKDIVCWTIKNLSALVTLKTDLFKVKDGGQDSHTFTNRDGSGSITIGYNAIIGFDGTETAGVQKVKEYLSTLSGDDEKRQILADLLNTFMKPDRKGNLNPTRIAELCNKKGEIDNPLFSDGIDTIVNAQFKTRTSMFVRGWQLVTKEGEADKKIHFSISA